MYQCYVVKVKSKAGSLTTWGIAARSFMEAEEIALATGGMEGATILSVERLP